MCKKTAIDRSVRTCIIRLLLCLLLAVFVLACSGGGGSSPNSSSSNTGGIAVGLNWKGSPAIRSSFDICATGVANVKVTVYNSSNPNVPVASAVFPCSAHTGTVGNIPVGSGYYVVVEADDSGGNPTWYGNVLNITVTSGSSTQTTVPMLYNTDLTSIAIAPANPSITNPSSQQFTATGTYNDSSTLDLTYLASWSSFNTGIATIGPRNGRATTVSVGSTTISATFLGQSGYTTLTVNASSSGVHSILGKVTSDGSTPLDHASVTCDGGGGYSTYSVNGPWSESGFAAGASTTCWASYLGHRCSPSSIPVTVNGSDIPGIDFICNNPVTPYSSQSVPIVPSCWTVTSTDTSFANNQCSPATTTETFNAIVTQAGSHFVVSYGSGGTATGSVLGPIDGTQDPYVTGPAMLIDMSGFGPSPHSCTGSGCSRTMQILSEMGFVYPDGSVTTSALWKDCDNSNPPVCCSGTQTLTGNSTNCGYVVSGTVTLDGSWLSGIQVCLTGSGSPLCTLTDSNGSYAFSGVQSGSYTITTASNTNYTFTPANIPISVTNANLPGQNFTASTTQPFNCSGCWRVTFNSWCGPPNTGFSGSNAFTINLNQNGNICSGTYSYQINGNMNSGSCPNYPPDSFTTTVNPFLSASLTEYTCRTDGTYLGKTTTLATAPITYSGSPGSWVLTGNYSYTNDSPMACPYQYGSGTATWTQISTSPCP